MKSGPLLIACALVVAACGGPPPRPRTVAEFVEDPTLLQGVIARCRAQGIVARDPECANALAAADRIADDAESKRVGDRTAEFERERAERRAREDAQRAAAERAAPKFDPYTSPVAADAPAGDAPVTTAPTSAATAAAATAAAATAAPATGKP
jgi:hypothetical protein